MLDGYLLAIYSSPSTDLCTLLNYAAFSYSYRIGSQWPTSQRGIPFAKEMYENKRGNCYHFSALFCWLAKGLGYDANVIAGSVPNRVYGTGAHSWVEIHIDGVTYMCDPERCYKMPSCNWYMVTYSNTPITYYK